MVCFLIPFIYNFLNSLSNNLVITIFVITLIITLTDLILSLNIMQNIKGSIEKMNKDKTVLRDATDDIKAVIKNVLSKKTYFYRRFIKSYDKFEYYRNGFVHKIKNRRKTIYNNLKIIFKNNDDLLNCLNKVNINPTLRVEQLNMDDIVSLANEIF